MKQYKFKMQKLKELIYMYFCKNEELNAQMIVGGKLCIHITAEMVPVEIKGILE